MFIKTQGGFTCPFVKNSDYGNWLNFEFYWPPRNDKALKNNLIEFKIKRKKNLYTKTQKVPWVIHNTECYFSALDQAGKLSKLSVFNHNHIKSTEA